MIGAGAWESKMFRTAVPAALLLAGLTAADAAQQKLDPATVRVEKRLSGLTPGESRNCLRRDRFSEMVTADGVILYVGGRTKVWRNDVSGHCNGLSRGDIVVTKSLNGDLCEGDVVQTRATIGGMLTGSCTLGKFTPYTK
jgi:hypothetical protein